VKARFVTNPFLVYGLARNRRSPKRPSEPRPSGVHPEEARVGRRREAFRLGMLEVTREYLFGKEEFCG